MILLLCCFGPRVLAIILEMAAVDLDALAAAMTWKRKLDR